MKIALAQINTTVGALAHNRDMIVAAWQKARSEEADLLVTPELALSGYPLDDLVLHRAFVDDVRKMVESLAEATREGPAILLGAPWKKDGHVYSAALLLSEGQVQDVVLKQELPHYGPFDEKRVFARGTPAKPIVHKGKKLGVMVCEDLWAGNHAEALKAQGAEILITLNASPFEKDKEDMRLAVAQEAVRKTGLPLIYVNMVGGNDVMLFDGASFMLDGAGKMSLRLPEWEEGVAFGSQEHVSPRLSHIESLYTGLVLSVRDYVQKNGFSAAVVGLSSGIDSALTSVMAADALGPEKVQTLMLASAITSTTSRRDATEVAANIGCAHTEEVGIDAPVQALQSELMKFWKRTPDNPVTMQNVQARLRMLALYAVSNENGHLVLNTSNKSEAAMGHSTFYGDTSGGYAPIVDVFKTNVYALARWRNENVCKLGLGRSGALIPVSILEKAPTPELSEGETDFDHLPPYPILDAILERAVERNESVQEIIAAGFDAETVRTVIDKMNNNEFKRNQMPQGPRVTRLSFSRRDRRYPVTNKYRDS